MLHWGCRHGKKKIQVPFTDANRTRGMELEKAKCATHFLVESLSILLIMHMTSTDVLRILLQTSTQINIKNHCQTNKRS